MVPASFSVFWNIGFRFIHLLSALYGILLFFLKFSKDSVLGHFLLCVVRYSGEIEAFYRKTDFQ